MSFKRPLNAMAYGNRMDLIPGNSYNLGLSWGVFKPNENSWSEANFVSSGNGNINSQTW